MSSDYIEEELTIMDERGSGTSDVIATGINIEDPIRTLDLAPVISAISGTNLKDVIELLNERRIGCVTVIDDDGDTIGIFTERDVLRKVINRDIDLSKEKVDDYMTKQPQTLSENDPVAFALNRMSDGSYRHIPITSNGKVKYMLSVKDIVDEIAFTYRKKVLNLPPDLKQQTTEYGG